MTRTPVTGLEEDPDVAVALKDAVPLPEGADRVGATFGTVKICGVFSEQKAFLGDALTRVLGTAHIHQNIHEECITATKMAVHCFCGDFHCQMNHGGLIGKTLDRGLGVGSPGTHQSLKKVYILFLFSTYFSCVTHLHHFFISLSQHDLAVCMCVYLCLL